MAEAVGFAAGIAGLIGITGQLGKGVLFLKGLLEDISNAPGYIRSLAAELELLGSAAAKTDKLLVKCRNDGLDFGLEEERKELKRYADMIVNLGTKIDKDVKIFGTGKGRWWERVGSAGRKKGVEVYLVGVERAKTLVLDVEMKIMMYASKPPSDFRVLELLTYFKRTSTRHPSIPHQYEPNSRGTTGIRR